MVIKKIIGNRNILIKIIITILIIDIFVFTYFLFVKDNNFFSKKIHFEGVVIDAQENYIIVKTDDNEILSDFVIVSTNNIKDNILFKLDDKVSITAIDKIKETHSNQIEAIKIDIIK